MSSSQTQKAKAEVRKWGETAERLLGQLDKARAELAAEQDKRRQAVLPAHTGEAGAKERLAAHDGGLRELKGEVAELEEAAADAEARRDSAEARLADAERSEAEREAAKLEAEAARVAEQVDRVLAGVGPALEQLDDLITQATQIRGRPVERRVPVQEALRRALAHNRIGDIHSVHPALKQPMTQALRFDEAGSAA